VQVVSVNAGRSELMRIGARTVETGIRKAPVERGHVGALGLAGDVVADEENHGGLDQALYLYSSEDYAFWADDLGAAPEPVVEVTAPRIPCSVFATRMGEPNWVKRFADARRPGLYVRVLEPGEVAAGDPVERLADGNGHPTVVDLMDAWYDAEPDAQLLERLLASPLAVRARANMERKLARLAG
jgi:MOSC domain-containing protein YiiM